VAQALLERLAGPAGAAVAGRGLTRAHDDRGPPAHPHRHRHRRHVHRRRRARRGDRRLVTTKTPSTPADPADGFLAAVDKVLGLLGATGADVATVSHGTTVATNQLLEGRLDRIGFITNDGYEHVLEIARSPCPTATATAGSGSSPTASSPPTSSGPSAAGWTSAGDELRPFDEDAAVRVARWFRDQGVTTLGVCFLHSYADPATSGPCARCCAASTPTPSCRCPATCCGSTASTSAASPRSSTRRSSRGSRATSPASGAASTTPRRRACRSG
jgi:hypothetical protein